MSGIEPHPIAILIRVWQIFTLPWSFGGMIWPEFSPHGPRIHFRPTAERGARIRPGGGLQISGNDGDQDSKDKLIHHQRPQICFLDDAGTYQKRRAILR